MSALKELLDQKQAIDLKIEEFVDTLPTVLEKDLKLVTDMLAERYGIIVMSLELQFKVERCDYPRVVTLDTGKS